MQCHRCPHHADVDAGKYALTPFEETPCAKCQLREYSGHTREFDEGRAGALGDLVAELPHPGAAEQPLEEDRLPISVMQDAIAAILCLRPRTRDIVCWRYAGMMYRDIAAILGVTTAGVELTHRRVLRREPALVALFGEKIAKQKRRKPHRRRR